MKINEAEAIVVCDVDNTLVKRGGGARDSDIIIKSPYSKVSHWYERHEDHIELLRTYKARGFYVIVWSANGVQHAASVVKALGLNDGTVDEVQTKPIKHVDDKSNPVHVVGSRVFIPKEGWSEE